MTVIVPVIAIVVVDQVKLFIKKYEMREHFFFLPKITTRIYYRNCIIINKENISKRIQRKPCKKQGKSGNSIQIFILKKFVFYSNKVVE
jgi:hypothetical protein